MTWPNFGYHLARFHGHMVRCLYRLLLPVIVKRPVHAPRSIDLDVFAYSREQDLPEQVASIRSFLQHAGRPRNFIVVSDDSHSDRSIRLLKQIDRSVSVQPASPAPPGYSDRFTRYLDTHPTGKQLRLVMSLPRDVPAFYTDSDVLFFEGASDLPHLLDDGSRSAYYLADCQFAGDERLLRDKAEQERPVNTGVLLLFGPLDWSVSLARFDAMEGDPTFFTNQTMTHLTMHENGSRPFDPARYVLQLDDQVVFRDRYANPRLVLRHYVNPVRHKFWTSLR